MSTNTERHNRIMTPKEHEQYAMAQPLSDYKNREELRGALIKLVYDGDIEAAFIDGEVKYRKVEGA